MRTLYLILLFLWLIIGYFICQRYICNQTGSSTASGVAAVAANDGDCSPALVLKDTSTDLDLISEENFKFDNSKDSYSTIGDDLSIILGTIVTHLGENPNTLMQIKGYYLAEETNNTNYENLGLARANMVKAYFLEQGVNSDQLKTMGKPGNPNCMDDGVLQKGIAIAFGSSK